MDNDFSQEVGEKISRLEPLKRVKRYVFRHKDRLLIFVGVILVGALSYQAGVLQSSVHQIEPLVISIPALPESEISEKTVSSSEEQKPSMGLERIVFKSKDVALPKDCLFIGSRNSDKYHVPTCAPAKRIKPENRVCFASKEDAEKRGYLAGCLK